PPRPGGRRTRGLEPSTRLATCLDATVRRGYLVVRPPPARRSSPATFSQRRNISSPRLRFHFHPAATAASIPTVSLRDPPLVRAIPAPDRANRVRSWPQEPGSGRNRVVRSR